MASAPSSTNDLCLYFLAILFPPVTVFFKRGCHGDFWINILLCILGWIPGIIHAWCVSSNKSFPLFSCLLSRYIISRTEGAM
ncbi:UPF0057-domain-containing protein [Tricholoma matsutake]|nr:UPF0057-domain-containing protein [Tricholoma matsutake 945]